MVKNVLYFDTTKKTKIEEISSFVKSKDEIIKMKNFGIDLVLKNRMLLKEIEDDATFKD